MSPEQKKARRRIDAIYGDQSHPYWHGDQAATREMEGYFRALYPEPAAQVAPVPQKMQSFALSTSVDGQVGLEQQRRRTPEQMTAWHQIDSVYADQTHPYWIGDTAATREMEGYFRTEYPEPGDSEEGRSLGSVLGFRDAPSDHRPSPNRALGTRHSRNSRSTMDRGLRDSLNIIGPVLGTKIAPSSGDHPVDLVSEGQRVPGRLQERGAGDSPPIPAKKTPDT